MKSKIVPSNRTFTIPWLELLGNIILSSLIRVEIFLWMDSFISLSWIRGVNQELRLFEQNRAIKICENVNPALWKYCGAKENPVEIITRFSSSNNLFENLSNNFDMVGRAFVFKRNQKKKKVCLSMISTKIKIKKFTRKLLMNLTRKL